MIKNIVDLKKIQILRKSRGISRDKMANLLGLSSMYSYKNKELGQRLFNVKDLYIISKFFHVSMEQLIIKDEEVKAND